MRIESKKDDAVRVSEPRSVVAAWILGTIAMSLVPYLILIRRATEGSVYVAQDDARHFVVWLRRFMDPRLYPHDTIAEQFAGITPMLYATVFKPFAVVGIDPVRTQLFIVMPLTGVALVLACFAFVHRIWPCARGAALASLIMVNVLAWPTGLAHDFGFTIVLLVLLAGMARRPLAAALVMFAGTKLLPAAALTACAALAAGMLRTTPPFFTRDRRLWVLFAFTMASCLIGGLQAVSAAATSGPTFTAGEAKFLPVFGRAGRKAYFGADIPTTYLCNARTGIAPFCEVDPGTTGDAMGPVFLLILRSGAQAIAWAILAFGLIGIAVTLVARSSLNKWLRRTAVPQLDPSLATVWAGLLVAGIVLFVFAHSVAFRLHMPERFARYSIALVFATALSLTIVVPGEVLVSRLRRLWQRWLFTTASLAVLLSLSVSSLAERANLVHGEAEDVYAFLQTTPVESVVAGVNGEIDNIPVFGWRSVLASLQLFLPWKKRNYEQMAGRMIGVATALYSVDAAAFATLRQRYRIDFLLVGRELTDDLNALREWSGSFPVIGETVAAVEAGTQPFFLNAIPACVVAESDRVFLLDATCLVQGGSEFRSPN